MIGNQIRVAREGLKLSQHKLAVRLGVTAPAVHCWETGKRKPNGHNLLMLMKVLKIKLIV